MRVEAFRVKCIARFALLALSAGCLRGNSSTLASGASPPAMNAPASPLLKGEPAAIEVSRLGEHRRNVLDVFDKEPLPQHSPFFALPNVILTPHSAGTTPETTEAGVALAIENIFQ